MKYRTRQTKKGRVWSKPPKQQTLLSPIDKKKKELITLKKKKSDVNVFSPGSVVD